MSRLVLLHTAASNVAVFEPLVRELLPGVTHHHVVDESLLRDTMRDGLTDFTRERVLAYGRFAERGGADLFLVTCSSIGVAAEAAGEVLHTAVLRVDEPMADAAVRTAPRIGVLATLASTLEPTADLLRRRAARAGREVDLEVDVCAGAFELLQDGRVDEHDARVAAAAALLAPKVGVIVLAQASMARAVPEGLPAPVLSSPRLGVARCAELLGST